MQITTDENQSAMDKTRSNPLVEKDDMITVAVVDDDVNIRNGLWWLLNNVVGIRCPEVYASFREAMTGLTERPPNIILLDVSMPETSGIDAIRSIRAQLPLVKIIMHSNYDDEEKILRSMRAGAAGYVLKNSSAPALYDAIMKVYQGGSVWPPGFEAQSTASRRGSKTTDLVRAFVQKLGQRFVRYRC
jgi:DNA-binding NarL/FixJ family response regulator